MGLPTVQMTSAGATTINTLQNAGANTSANSHPMAFPTDQGPQPYTGSWTNRSGNITNAQIQSNTVAVLGGALSHNYVPADTITLADGGSVHGVLTVTTTGVSAASINAAGTFTGTTGTYTVTGTTGTGTFFTASCTLTNGSGITAVLSILTAGVYTVNPTTLTAEPVTATNLASASLNIKMGVVAASVTTPGNVTAIPANPVAQSSSSGVGTGATFNLTYIGISQTLMALNASRKAMLIGNPSSAAGQNIAAAESLFVNFTSAAGVNDGVSVELTPGGYINPGLVTSTELVTVDAQTLGHRYIAREM